MNNTDFDIEKALPGIGADVKDYVLEGMQEIF